MPKYRAPKQKMHRCYLINWSHGDCGSLHNVGDTKANKKNGSGRPNTAQEKKRYR